MSNNHVCRLLMPLALLLFAALPGSFLQAEELSYRDFIPHDYYDLDSLLHLATDVVEVKVLRYYGPNGRDLIDAKVSLVHKGGLKTGESVVVACTDYYERDFGNDNKPQPLVVGDRLVLFLARLQATALVSASKNGTLYAPVVGGVRLIEGNRVFGFSQSDNPDLGICTLYFERASRDLPTVAGFREKLRVRLSKTQEWTRLVEAEQNKLDGPRVLALLAQRSKEVERTDFHSRERDYFAERACARLVELRKPDELSQALSLVTTYSETSILQRGFGTSRGLDYLLARIADSAVPLKERLRYADALWAAGVEFAKTNPDLLRQPSETENRILDYPTRIVKAARENAPQEKLCIGLIKSVCGFQKSSADQNKVDRGDVAEPKHSKRKPAPLQEDLGRAFRMLEDFYKTKPSEEVQYAIESVLFCQDTDAYKRLESPCGDFLSIVRPDDFAELPNQKKRCLRIRFEYTRTLGDASELQPDVVLIHQGTKKRYVFPRDFGFSGFGGGGMTTIDLPADLSSGRYHVFFQVLENGKAVHTGHYLAVDL